MAKNFFSWWWLVLALPNMQFCKTVQKNPKNIWINCFILSTGMPTCSLADSRFCQNYSTVSKSKVLQIPDFAWTKICFVQFTLFLRMFLECFCDYFCSRYLQKVRADIEAGAHFAHRLICPRILVRFFDRVGVESLALAVVTAASRVLKTMRKGFILFLLKCNSLQGHCENSEERPVSDNDDMNALWVGSSCMKWSQNIALRTKESSK